MNGGSGGSEPLKTATAIVGLLAGLVAAIYVLGGLVIALRLLVGGFAPGSVAAIVGQLPRELVVTTALLGVGLPAVIAGLLGIGLFESLREFNKAPLDLPNNPRQFIALGLISAALILPGALLILGDDLSTFAWIALLLLGWGFAVLFANMAWRELKRFARNPRWTLRIGAVGGCCALAAFAPAVLLAAGVDFEDAQVCTTAGQVPEAGLLVGEGGGQVLLATNFADEESIVAIPSDKVTKTEYGDLSSTFTCPAPPGAAAVAKVALEKLGGHGSAAERDLAMALRPRIRFDSLEPWRPIEVGTFLAERFDDGGRHGACARGAEPPCADAEGLAQLRAGPDGPAYLDIRGRAANGADYASAAPGCLRSPPAVDCNSGPPAVIYYRRTSHDGRWYWDYWWFLRYNDYNGNVNRCVFVCGDHEGDWEGITVITTPSLKPEVLGAIYAAHGDRVFVDATVLPTSAGHPLVWVAKGTHASYAFDCDEDCSQYGGLPEESHDGAVPWGGNRDEACAAERCVRPLPDLGHSADAALPFAGAWAAWPGRWGETCHNGCRSPISHRESSPVSPGRQPRFECPWVPNRRARPAADGLSEAARTGDFERLMAACRAQRGGV